MKTGGLDSGLFVVRLATTLGARFFEQGMQRGEESTGRHKKPSFLPEVATVGYSYPVVIGYSMKKGAEHTLEFLLDFNGRIHRYDGGYWLKFEIAKGKESEERPHGLYYSFTLHGPDNKRLLGFDNAHGVAAKGSRFGQRPKAMDHWHRTEADEGRPYAFIDAETLIDNFFNEVERVLQSRGIPLATVEVTEGDSP